MHTDRRAQPQNFTYDAYGNLTKNVITGDGGVAWNPMYDNNNHYTLTGTSYDNDGNLKADTFHSYTWDAFGGVTAIDSTTVTHDAFGRIVEFKGTTTRQFLYTPSGINLAKMNGQTLDTARVPLPGGNIADYHASGFNAYGHADWLGTTRFGSTSSRTKDGDWAVAPFGETYAGGTSSYSDMTGKFDDIGSLLWDFPMREYHSTQGRWISPDPAGLAAVNPMNPQTWNRYAYVGGNPLGYIDPLGLTCAEAKMTPRGPSTCWAPTGGGSVGQSNCALDGVDTPCGVVDALFLGGGLDLVPTDDPGGLVTPTNSGYLGTLLGISYTETHGTNGDFGFCFGLAFNVTCYSYTASSSDSTVSPPGPNSSSAATEVYPPMAQVVFQGNRSTWQQASMTGNRLAVATGGVIVGIPLVGEGLGAISACDPGLNISYGHATVYCRAWMAGNLIGLGYDPHNGLHVNVGGSIHIPLWPWN